jgi:hypothetical protein
MIISATQGELCDKLLLDASGSSSPSGELDKVIVEVVAKDGEVVKEVVMDRPYMTTVKPGSSGTFTYRAVAVDQHGQRSDPWEAVVEVHPRMRVKAGTFIAHEQRETEELGARRGSLIVAAEGGLSYMLRRNLEIGATVGGFLNTNEQDASGLFADAEFNWVGARGFAGFGVGLWDPSNSETSDASWLMHAGQDTKWEVAGWPLQLYLEARFFLDTPGNAQDNFVFALGARVRLN